MSMALVTFGSPPPTELQQLMETGHTQVEERNNKRYGRGGTTNRLMESFKRKSFGVGGNTNKE